MAQCPIEDWIIDDAREHANSAEKLRLAGRDGEVLRRLLLRHLVRHNGTGSVATHHVAPREAEAASTFVMGPSGLTRRYTCTIPRRMKRKVGWTVAAADIPWKGRQDDGMA